MGTYIIIGGDGKEYGPISAADLRQWIAEGRLNSQSLAKSVSDAEFRPLEKFPEFADLWAGSHPPAISPLPSAADLSGEYELDLGACIAAGYELTKKHFGALFASVLVLIGFKIALSSLINFTLVASLTKIFTSAGATVGLGILLVILNAPVMGPLMGGVFLIFLKSLRGEKPAMGEIFAGFQKSWSQLFLGSLIVSLIGALCMAPASYVVAVKVNPFLHQMQNLQAQGNSPADMGKLLSQMMSAYASSLPILLICIVPFTYLNVCFQFTQALILDKQLDPGTALKTGWKRVNQHWWLVFGLTILVGLIEASGVLACGVGLLFTIPVGIAVMMSGYETIFSAKKP